MIADLMRRNSRFLQAPTYASHPYAEVWADRIAGRKPNMWNVALQCLCGNVALKWKNMNPKLHPDGKRGIQRAIFDVSAILFDENGQRRADGDAEG